MCVCVSGGGDGGRVFEYRNEQLCYVLFLLYAELRRASTDTETRRQDSTERKPVAKCQTSAIGEERHT